MGSEAFPARKKRTSPPKKKATDKRARPNGDSPVSESDSAKALKDAMLKTTQKIYFPSSFKLPKPLSRKNTDSSASRTNAAAYAQVKHSYVNLESEQESLLSCSAPFKPEVSRRVTTQAAPAYEPSHHGLSIEQMVETTTTKSSLSKMSGTATRRSRQERSNVKTGPKRASYPKGTGVSAARKTPQPVTVAAQRLSLHPPLVSQKTDVSPLARVFPGSEAISLELNVQGMTEPNKTILVDEDTIISSQGGTLEPEETPAIQMAVKRAFGVNSVEYKGVLNRFVQQTGNRSKTPLLHADSYSTTVSTVERAGTLSRLGLHKKSASNSF